MVDRVSIFGKSVNACFECNSDLSGQICLRLVTSERLPYGLRDLNVECDVPACFGKAESCKSLRSELVQCSIDTKD